MKKTAELNNQLLGKKEKLVNQFPEAKISARHQKGKLTARERINLLLDPGSFQEIDPFVKSNDSDQYYGDGVIGGFGLVNDETIYVYAQDFINKGGSFAEANAKKIVKLQEMALSSGCPIIALNDSGGARIQEGVKSLAGVASVFYQNAQSSGVIPQIAAIMGPCAGGAVYSPALMDFIIMVKETSHMFITGPEVIKEVTNEQVSFDDLGGSGVHAEQSGVAHFQVDSEEECLELIRKLLSYLPHNNIDHPKATAFQESSLISKLDSVIPDDDNKGYDIKEVINTVFDQDSLLEVMEDFSPNIIVGFVKLQGKTVGIVANNPLVLAGTIDINASLKAARFIRFCDAFNIPLITFEDVPGFLPGVEQEKNGIIKHGAKLLYAYCEATVPRLTVILRKSYGGTYCVMNSKHIGADFVYAWPTAQIAVMGAKGAINIVNRKELAEADDVEATRAELEKEYNETFLNPYLASQEGYVDNVIMPSKTREILIHSLNAIQNKVTKSFPRKHGNIPL